MKTPGVVFILWDKDAEDWVDGAADLYETEDQALKDAEIYLDCEYDFNESDTSVIVYKAIPIANVSIERETRRKVLRIGKDQL